MIKRIKKVSIQKKGLLTGAVFFLLCFFGAHPVEAAKFNASQNLKQTSGLVGLWSFDGKDISSGVALDRSGSGNNGNLLNIATSTFYANGKIGQAFNFDGTNDYVGTIGALSSYSFIQNTNVFTLSGWLKVNDATTRYGLIGNGDSTAHKGFFATFENGAGAGTKALRIVVMNGSGSAANSVILARTADNAITDTNWHHFAIIGSRSGSTNSVTFYVDGVAQSTTYENAQTNALSTGDSTNKLNIGDVNGTVLPFGGKLDEFRIYNRALSATEVKALYLAGGGKQNASQNLKLTSGLIGLWSFDGKDISSGIALDRSGNGNNVNLLNIATSTFYTNGKIGQAFNFDGSNDYATTTLNLSGQSIVTVSFWGWQNSYTNGDELFMEFTPDTNSNNGFYIDPNAGGVWRPSMRVSGNITNRNFTQPTVPNMWHHYVVQFDGSTNPGTIEAWFDGVAQSGAYNTQAANGGTFTNSTLYLMSRGGASLINGGKLDEVRIYNRKLTTSEINALYKQGLSKQNASQNLKLTSGLIGLWSFDGKDISSGVAVDRSGSGNNGRLQGPIATSTFYTNGKIGQGFSLDGTDDHVSVVNAGTIFNPGTSNFTYSAWIKPSGSGSRVIMGMYNGNAQVSLYINTSNFAVFSIRDSSGNASAPAGSTALNDGGWHHVVGVRTGESGGGGLLYVDGALVSTGATGVTSMGIPCIALFIGAFRSSNVCSENFTVANENFFNGSLDDVRVYNRALTATEVNALYNMGR